MPVTGAIKLFLLLSHPEPLLIVAGLSKTMGVGAGLYQLVVIDEDNTLKKNKIERIVH